MRKLTLSLLFVVLIAIIGLGWGLDRIFENVANQKYKDELTVYKDFGVLLASILDTIEDPHIPSAEKTDMWPGAASLQSADDFLLPPELNRQLDLGEPLVLESDDGISLHFLLQNSNKILTLLPGEHEQQLQKNRLSLLFTIMFYSGILLLILLWLYPLVSRLLKLRDSARQFGNGNLEERIKPGKLSYIRDIESEFNRMADKIQSLISDNKLLSNAVSHDLRTPLARLRFGIDTLAEFDDPAKRMQYQGKISKDLDEMESLVTTLLSYARLDQSMQVLQRMPVDLGEVVEGILDTVSNPAKKLHWRNSSNTCIILGDKRHLIMLVNNLLQNANKYALTTIKVTLVSTQNSKCCLRVEDDGPGIPIESCEDVLKPFVRGKDDINSVKSDKGYGMGLAIVARISQWHKARVSIDRSEDLGGARLSVEFEMEKAL